MKNVKLKMSTRPQVTALFTEGYSVRHCIATLKSCGIKEANICFNEEGIVIQKDSDDRSVVATVTIRGNDLQKYEYIPQEVNGIRQPYILRGFLVAEMYNSLASIRKKDGIVIFVLPDDENIYIQPLKASKDNTPSGYDIIRGRQVEHNEWGFPPFDDVPNAKALASVLNSNCGAMLNAKSVHVEFTSVAGGVRMKGFRADGSSGSTRNLGECAPTETGRPVFELSMPSVSGPSTQTNSLALKFDPEMLRSQAAAAGKCSVKVDTSAPGKSRTVHIPQKIVRALSKINNVGSASSLVNVFISTGEDLVMQITSPIGACSYGTLSLCINDHDVSN